MYDKDIKKKGSGQMSRNEMEIRIEGLEKYYGKKHALKNVTLTIPSGMFGLLGRNGAGKTTLMKVLATLIGKQGGKVTGGRGGQDPQNHRVSAAGVFHVSQHGSL